MASFYSITQTLYELLHRLRWRAVEFRAAIDQTETPPEFRMMRVCIVSSDIEAAAHFT